MKDFEEIRKLWDVQDPVSGLPFEDVLKAVKHSSKGYARKLLIQAVSVAMVLFLIVIIWFFVSFITWTTHLSLLIITACVSYYFVIELRDYLRIKDSSAMLRQPEKYLEYLKRYRASRYRLNTRNYKIYLFCISLAIGVYAIEMYFIMPAKAFYAYLLFSAIWVFICYFVFMKAYIRRENERLQDMISRLETIKQQFQ